MALPPYSHRDSQNPATPSPAVLPGPVLTLSPRISPRCSCRRRLTSRMRLLWSSIALTFSASARRRLRIRSSLLHCSSSSSVTLDRSSTPAGVDTPAGAEGQLSAAGAAPAAAFDMVSAQRQVRVGGSGERTGEGAGAAGRPPPTPLCASRVSGTSRGPLRGDGEDRAARPSYLAIQVCVPAESRGPTASSWPLLWSTPTPSKSMMKGAGEQEQAGTPRGFCLNPLPSPVLRSRQPPPQSITHTHTPLPFPSSTPRLRCSSSCPGLAERLGFPGRLERAEGGCPFLNNPRRRLTVVLRLILNCSGKPWVFRAQRRMGGGWGAAAGRKLASRTPASRNASCKGQMRTTLPNRTLSTRCSAARDGWGRGSQSTEVRVGLELRAGAARALRGSRAPPSD